MLAEQEKQRKAFEKKKAEEKRQQQIKEIKVKMDKIKAKMKVKQQYLSMKTQHGGLTGTEDTGYNDDDMSLFLKRPVYLQIDEPQAEDLSFLQQADNVDVEDEPSVEADDLDLMITRGDFEEDQFLFMLQEHRNQVLIDHI